MEHTTSRHKTLKAQVEAYDKHVRAYNEAIFKPEDLSVFAYKIEKYFEDCAKKKIPPRRPGLALALGMSIKTLEEYKHREPFKQSYAMAMTRMEDYLVGSVLEENRKNIVGPMFVLKANYDYIEKQNIQIGNAVTLKIDKDEAKLCGVEGND
jgi:hypothetical protein